MAAVVAMRLRPPASARRRSGTRDFRAARMKVFSYAVANDFETDFRRVLSRRNTVAAI